MCTLYNSTKIWNQPDIFDSVNIFIGFCYFLKNSSFNFNCMYDFYFIRVYPHITGVLDYKKPLFCVKKKIEHCLFSMIHCDEYYSSSWKMPRFSGEK